MKILKKLLLVAVAALTFVACGDDDNEEDNNSTTKIENISNWNGTLTVTSQLGDFEMSDLGVVTTCTDSSKNCKVEMNQVKFANQMPKQLDLVIDGLTFSVSDGDTIITGTDISSQYVKEGELLDAGYAVTSISGKISNGKLSMDVTGSYTSMNNMSINFSYAGERK
jgi:hypothetical protein